MTRSYKYTDRDYSAEEGQQQVQHVPKFFGKAGFVDTDPKKVKKEGGGKGNWGHPGAEIEDTSYTMTNPRRRSNSSTHARGAKDFKTKFEVVEAEPVFEDYDMEDEEEHIKLEHQSSTSTTSDSQSSVEEEH